MSTPTLKSTFRRSGLLVAAFALVAATFAPAASTYADALNPLTERSLTLSSSSPGWSYLDASGNPTFAPPNSGANGQKAGNTFSFRVSSTQEVNGMSFQYCTNPAGDCYGPGNNAVVDDLRTPNGTNPTQSDLQVATDNPSEVTTYATKFNASTGQPAGYTGGGQWDSNTAHPNLPARDNSEGNFIVLTKTNLGDPWVQSVGWDMVASVRQDGIEADGTNTNKANYITLVNDGTDLEANNDFVANDYVKVIFFATDTNYITNPGDKEFFVKINTFDTAVAGDFDDSETSTNRIDGGVTVANVMNRSIEIQTKVLETMDFSVGTVDPKTLDSTGGAASQLHAATGASAHTPCAPIVQGMGGGSTLPDNVLQLGNPNGEFSLRTDTTYSTHSYWRLSSNSSGGATVYYSGVTLSNTVGDQIDAIGTTAAAPARGSEQFGLALDHERTGDRLVSYAKERDPEDSTDPENVTGGIFQNGADNAVGDVHASFATDMAAGSYTYHAPRLTPLAPLPGYGNGAGAVNADRYTGDATEFAFDPESSAIPTPFATGTEVLDCVTGKMRYIANIAATTPAGVYTTKINYIAAPQY